MGGTTVAVGAVVAVGATVLVALGNGSLVGCVGIDVASGLAVLGAAAKALGLG